MAEIKTAFNKNDFQSSKIAMIFIQLYLHYYFVVFFWKFEEKTRFMDYNEVNINKKKFSF